eukprot:TRINITY_DN9327_c0_g1_i3.p1 TRINITY_DN9327_c0_g1~~TRINITY_DN9327_c0_g1_i3.p1  ORF type:complete len:568 (-),score=174.15 TRINITY_DN9327_c0_g1_i3:1021-2724(-)
MSLGCSRLLLFVFLSAASCGRCEVVGVARHFRGEEAGRRHASASIVVEAKGQSLLRPSPGATKKRQGGHHLTAPKASQDHESFHEEANEEAERLSHAAKEAAAAAAKIAHGEHLANVTGGAAKRIDEVMRVQLDAKGDLAALQLSILLAAAMCCGFLLFFGLMRTMLPELYEKRELERRSGEAGSADGRSEEHWLPRVLRLQADEVIEYAGLDAWMHLEFQKLALKMTLFLSPVMLVLFPLHWSGAASEDDFDLLSRLGLSATEDRSTVTWTHVAVVWFVVVVTTKLLNEAQASFLQLRQAWLARIPHAQAATLLIEGIPDAHCADNKLRDYYAGLFTKGAVVSGYVVRKTSVLWSKLARLEGAQYMLEVAEKAVTGSESGGASPSQPSAVRRLETVELRKEQLTAVEQEVAAERMRLLRSSDAFDPDLCASSGFVTFRTRRDMRLALGQQLATDERLLVTKPAPDPKDILYSSLMTSPGTTRSTLGYSLLAGLFVSFAPLVVLVSGLLSLDTLQRVLPRVAAWRLSLPKAVDTMLERVAATMGLNFLMAILPTFFLIGDGHESGSH